MNRKLESEEVQVNNLPDGSCSICLFESEKGYKGNGVRFMWNAPKIHEDAVSVYFKEDTIVKDPKNIMFFPACTAVCISKRDARIVWHRLIDDLGWCQFPAPVSTPSQPNYALNA